MASTESSNEKPHLQDNKRLLDIFPEEVWSMILSRVETPKQYQNISSSADLFMEHLRPRRLCLMFHSVMKLLLKQKKVLLKSTELLALRGVCRSWKDTIEKVFYNFRFTDHFSIETFDQTDFPDFAALNYDEEKWDAEFRRTNVFVKFENHFDSTHLKSGVNPFLKREVFVNCPMHTEDLYFEAFVGMLTKYGHHIYKCTVNFQDDWRFRNGFYKQLEAILNNMPNLKSFIVESPEDCLKNDEDEFEEGYYATLTLPCLERLETLHLDNMPSFVVHKLIQSNPQIKEAKILGYNDMKYFKFWLESLPNLKELTVAMGSMEKFLTFSNATVSCHPSKLNMYVHFVHIPGDGLFRSMEQKFGSWVRVLDFFVSRADLLFYYSGLRFPKLKHLKLHMDFPTCIDFILPLKESLETLSIEIFEHEDLDVDSKKNVKESGQIKIFKNWKKPYMSNIWEKIPKLKNLKITFDELEGGKWFSCNRKAWIEYNKGK